VTSPRKVIYSVGASLDGYIASPDGSYEWLERETRKAKGEDFGMKRFFASIDTVIMGRKTYEVGVKHGMAKSGFPGMRNYVFSRTVRGGSRYGVEFVSGDPLKLVTRLKRQPGKDIWLCGGGDLAREFLKRGALDEVGVGIVPLLVGAGRPTFPPGFAQVGLELMECKQYPTGVVVLHYRIVPRGRHPAARSGRSRRVPRGDRAARAGRRR